MSYGTDLGITLPTVGVTAGPDWATSLNTALTSIIAVLETKVTPAGMDINADLSFRSGSTSYMATDVKALEFTNQDSTLAAGTYPTTMFSCDGDGELYYNDNAGRQIQVTSNGAVNVSSAGGITGGGYGSNSVEVNWNGSTKYSMRTGAAADDYASVHVNDVLLNDGSAHTITVAAPSISADYTLTLPTAVPAGNGTIVQMATTGALSASNTVASLTTNSGGITAAAGQDIAVSTTGKYKHGARTVVIPGCAFAATLLSGTAISADNGGHLLTSASDRTLVAPIILPVGKVISAINYSVVHGAGGGTRVYSVLKRVLVTPANSTLDTTSSTVSGSVFQFSRSFAATITADTSYFVVITFTEDGDGVYGVELTYTE